MIDDENASPQQAPYISTSISTPFQFVHTIKSFLDQNNVTTVGPFRMEVQQKKENDTGAKRFVLLLKGELRFVEFPLPPPWRDKF